MKGKSWIFPGSGSKIFVCFFLFFFYYFISLSFFFPHYSSTLVMNIFRPAVPYLPIHHQNHLISATHKVGIKLAVMTFFSPQTAQISHVLDIYFPTVAHDETVIRGRDRTTWKYVVNGMKEGIIFGLSVVYKYYSIVMNDSYFVLLIFVSL